MSNVFMIATRFFHFPVQLVMHMMTDLSGSGNTWHLSITLLHLGNKGTILPSSLLSTTKLCYMSHGLETSVKLW